VEGRSWSHCDAEHSAAGCPSQDADSNAGLKLGTKDVAIDARPNTRGAGTRTASRPYRSETRPRIGTMVASGRLQVSSYRSEDRPQQELVRPHEEGDQEEKYQARHDAGRSFRYGSKGTLGTWRGGREPLADVHRERSAAGLCAQASATVAECRPRMALRLIGETGRHGTDLACGKACRDEIADASRTAQVGLEILKSGRTCANGVSTRAPRARPGPAVSP
jgi:hypothetical protein